MKFEKVYLLLTLCFFCYSSCVAQKVKTIDVYLIGGQSNATGQGYLRNMADSMRIDATVLLFNSGKPHLDSGLPAYTWQPMHQASESPDRFGPELGFAHKIHLIYPGKKIALIKHAHSGADLYHDWNPGKDEHDLQNWGEQFKEFVRTVNLGLEGLRKMGYKPIIKGMIWQQGESDATKDSVALLYAQNLTHFIERVRGQFHLANMPFVYGYVLPPPNIGRGRNLVRKAQHDIDQDSGSELAVKNTFVVSTDDLSQRCNDKNTPYPEDHIHFGTDGTWLLGVRMATQMALAP